MAKKGKLEKFALLDQMPNVFQNFGWEDPKLINYERKVVDYKGEWAEKIFQNDHPIILELACGYGEYTIAMAERYPDTNFIGIDIKGNRIFTGANHAIKNGLNNAAFVRIPIELLGLFFGEDEISEIWIPFADPHFRKSKHKKRLTSSRFLAMYKKLLIKDGVIHVKTDSDLLYDYTLSVIEEEKHEILENYPDLYNSDFDNELLAVKTRYERLNPSGSDTVKYVKFRLKD